MELRHLRYFVAVAEERHFGRAAARLHIAQPPLSQQIRQLESELGVQLLRRTTRRVDLTAAGEAYLVRARQIITAVSSAAGEAQRVAAGLQGRLVIGCVGSATYSLLPHLVRTLRDGHYRYVQYDIVFNTLFQPGYVRTDANGNPVFPGNIDTNRRLRPTALRPTVRELVVPFQF